MQFQCRSCGAYGTRKSNGDNSICTECGTPDDFKEVQPNMRMEDIFSDQDDNLDENEHRFGDKLGEKV